MTTDDLDDDKVASDEVVEDSKKEEANPVDDEEVPKDLDDVIEKSEEIVTKAKTVKKKKKAKAPQEPDVHPLDQFGPVRKAFILDNIRTIEYEDLSKLIGIKVEDLKAAVEKAGIKLPIDRARKWADLDVGTFKSLADCARCPVQLQHVSFYVGLKKCDKCLEKNIKLWIESGIPVAFPFSR